MNDELPDALLVAELSKRQRWVALLAVGVIPTVFVILASGLVTGERWQYVLVGVFLCYGVATSFIWRCPKCEGRLGRNIRPRACPHCGARFRR
jgi:hypothetical protein